MARFNALPWTLQYKASTIKKVQVAVSWGTSAVYRTIRKSHLPSPGATAFRKILQKNRVSRKMAGSHLSSTPSARTDTFFWPIYDKAERPNINRRLYWASIFH